jgi:hypothetical protein
MIDTAENPRAVIGDNAPPPIEGHRLNVEDLYAEAKEWLDGEGIQTEGQAQEVAKLLDMLRQAHKAADAARAAEKKPHDDAAKAVQAAWKPLLDKADLAIATAKKAIAPYLERKDAEQRAIAQAAREEAARIAAQAEEAARAARPDDLEAQAALEATRKAAAAAERVASKADKARPNVAGAARAVTLRTTYVAELTNAKDALRFYMERQPEALKEWLLEQAQRDVNAGAHTIPGFNIREERNAA